MKFCPGRIIIHVVLFDITRDYNTVPGVHDSGPIYIGNMQWIRGILG